MQQAHNSAILDLKKTFEKKVGALETQITDLKRRLDNQVTLVEWRIPNFSGVRRSAAYLQSDKFKLADFQWFIGLYTKGDSPESQGFFALYLFLDMKSLPKHKHITLKYKIKVKNFLDSSKD